jgi:hypothetical protein
MSEDYINYNYKMTNVKQKQTAVEWLVQELKKSTNYRGLQNIGITHQELIDQAKEMDKEQQDTFAIEFAEWYENDVLAKGDYEMIAKDKKELLEIFKETYGKQ